MNRIIRTELALRDLEGQSEYIRQRNPRAALRFLQAAEATFRQIAFMPTIGERFVSDQKLYQDLRCTPISGFPSHVIYFKPLADGVLVVRVIHGARDVDRIFGTDDNPDQT